MTVWWNVGWESVKSHHRVSAQYLYWCGNICELSCHIGIVLSEINLIYQGIVRERGWVLQDAQSPVSMTENVLDVI